MAGKIVSVIPRTSFSMAGAASTSTLVRVGPRAISSIDWVSSVLVVRLHSKSFASTTATVQVSVVNVSVSADDPGVLFLPPGNLGFITILNADAAPLLYETTLATPIGPMVAVGVSLLQGTSLGTCTWEMSIDLLGRDA